MPKVKKTSSVIHPNSRKALQLSREVFRNERLEKRKGEANLKQKIKLTKLNWFKENLDASKKVYTPADVKELVEKYLNRFEEEMTKEDVPKSLKRHASSSTFHDYKSKFLIENERHEFEVGRLEIPDLLQKKTFAIFKAWNGDIDLVPAIEIVTVSKKQFEKKKSAQSKEPTT